MGGYFLLNKRDYVYILVIIIVSLISRIAFNLYFNTPWFGDEPSLFAYTLNVVRGQYYGTNGAYWPPGYIFFMGLLFKLFGIPQVPGIPLVKK